MVLFCFIMQAIKVLNMIKLYGKPIRVNKVSYPTYEVFSVVLLTFGGICGSN